ncbi:MAG: hypothetical protein ABEH65_12435, partial [Halobacteriales archaeon]
MGRDVNRRDFLRAVVGCSIGGIAGCANRDDASATDDRDIDNTVSEDSATTTRRNNESATPTATREADTGPTPTPGGALP